MASGVPTANAAEPPAALKDALADGRLDALVEMRADGPQVTTLSSTAVEVLDLDDGGHLLRLHSDGTHGIAVAVVYESPPSDEVELHYLRETFGALEPDVMGQARSAEQALRPSAAGEAEGYVLREDGRLWVLAGLPARPLSGISIHPQAEDEADPTLGFALGGVAVLLAAVGLLVGRARRSGL